MSYSISKLILHAMQVRGVENENLVELVNQLDRARTAKELCELEALCETEIRLAEGPITPTGETPWAKRDEVYAASASKWAARAKARAAYEWTGESRIHSPWGDLDMAVDYATALLLGIPLRGVAP